MNLPNIALLNATNPYYSGCLHQKVEGWSKPRICASSDPPEAAALGFCQPPPFEEYMEIRISTGNWNSATALGWLTQIFLSEILGVPSTIESGAYGSSRDFYDPHSSLDYDVSYHPDALAVATDLPDNDCRSLIDTNTNEEDYQHCAHFVPEFWSYPLQYIKDHKIEPPQATGFLGKESWFLTKFTADEHPELVSYHGLQGEKNRQKLAGIFKRPTTWSDYCQEVSETNCTEPDDVALRPPQDEQEAVRMFAPELYKGHFRFTEKNNCTANPDNCTGHIANYPCGWTSFMEMNLYHMDIALDSHNGPGGTPGGYTADQLKEMWDAANATRSDLMMIWWTPEPHYQRYLGEDAEFQPVMLKPYTRECQEAQGEQRDECSPNFTDRVGSPEGACDSAAISLQNLISKGLYNAVHSPDIPEAARSPAYDVLRRFQISSIQLGELFDLWESEPTPRDAVCTWAVTHLDFMYSIAPTSYPRVVQEKAQSVFGHVTTAIGCLATIVIVLTSWFVYQNREEPAISFAQVDFLSFLLVGSALVCLGSILTSLPASDATCLSALWFVNIGYNLQLVPLIVKVAAINRVMAAARAMRRIRLKRQQLYGAVALIGGLVVVYLTVWSVVDPTRRKSEYALTESFTADRDERIVSKAYYCSGGNSEIWQYGAVIWNAILLLCASVLAFQSRNTVKVFNESRTLAFLIYSHFVFVAFRMTTYLLSGHVKGSRLDLVRALLYATDQILGCIIYFWPKLTAKEEGLDEMANDFDFGSSRRISGLSSDRRASGRGANMTSEGSK